MTVSNAAIAEVFRNAKKRVWDGIVPYHQAMGWPRRYGTVQYICWAIENDRCDTAMSRAEVRARNIVMSRLDFSGSLEGWVCKSFRISWNAVNSTAGMKKMQATRHAWLDSLIAEFSSK